MTQAITALVKDGVLSQTEADTIIANAPAKHADRDKGPFQSLTDKQKTALESELQTLSASSIKGLVSDGTITQAQADILSQHGFGKMGGPGKGGHR
jgi:competence protein ComGC